jgi:hypothetical protein
MYAKRAFAEWYVGNVWKRPSPPMRAMTDCI